MIKGSLALGFAALAAAALAAGPAPAIHLDFDSDQRGTAPAWLRFESTRGMTPDRWLVQPDARPQSLPNVAIQTVGKGEPGQYRFALSSEAKAFTDGKIRVAVEPKSTGGFCVAGVVLRYRGPGDFLAAVYETGSAELEIFEVRAGKRESLGRAKVESLERGWITVGLAADAGALEASVSGRKVLEARDPHVEPGEAGMITEGPTVAGFDELQIERR